MLRIGVISDTHGLLRPEALAALQGCDHIIHAGDIGNENILQILGEIAAVTAIRGNNDKGTWAKALQETRRLQFEDVYLYVIHDIKELDIQPAAEDISVVISGHSHKPVIKQDDGVLYLNPGSAGPRRFKLPITVAELIIDEKSIAPRITQLG